MPCRGGKLDSLHNASEAELQLGLQWLSALDLVLQREINYIFSLLRKLTQAFMYQDLYIFFSNIIYFGGSLRKPYNMYLSSYACTKHAKLKVKRIKYKTIYNR